MTLSMLQEERKHAHRAVQEELDDKEIKEQSMHKQQYVQERMRDKEEWRSSQLFKSLKKTEDLNKDGDDDKKTKMQREKKSESHEKAGVS